MGALLGFFGASPARLQALLVGALAAATVCLALTAWALLERSWRFQCKAELVVAVDQAKVLGAALERQSESITRLHAASEAIAQNTAHVLDQVERQHARTRATVAGLEAKIQAPTPAAATGAPKGCADYLKEWRAEP